MTSGTSVFSGRKKVGGARVGAYTLETLTTGMYADPLDALREYLQNALDGVTEAEDLGLIAHGEGIVEILVDRPAKRMTFKDNGAGLSPTHAFEILTSVGMSRKDATRFAGFRGIGRLAGIAYCSNLAFRTSQVGNPQAVTVSFDCKALRTAIAPTATAKDLSEVIHRCVRYEDEVVPDDDHFFEVILAGMDDCPPAMLDPKTLQHYLCQRAPVDFDSQIWPYRDTILDFTNETGHRIPVLEVIVRDETGDSFPILKPYKTHYRTERDDDCYVTGVLLLPEGASKGGWWGWLGKSDLPGAISDKKSAGIRLRIKNIQIGDRTVMDDIFRSISDSYVRFNGWYIGEIHIEEPGVIPNGRRDGFEDTPAWRRIAGELETLARDISSKCYQQSQDRRKSAQKVEREVSRTTLKIEDQLQQGFPSREQRDNAKEDVIKRRTRVAAALKGSRSDHERKRIEAALNHLQALERDLDEVRTFRTDRVFSRLDRRQRQVLKIVFDVLNQHLDQAKFEEVQKAIMNQLASGGRRKD